MSQPDHSPPFAEELDKTQIMPVLPPEEEPYVPPIEEDSGLREMLEPSRAIFIKYREAYTESLSAILHSGGLQVQSKGPDGTLRMGAVRVGLGMIETSTGVSAGPAYRATYLAVRGGTSGRQRSEASRPPLIADYFDLTDAAHAIRGITNSSYFQADTILKVTIPLTRFHEGQGDRFENEVTGPDGSMSTIPYIAPREEAREEFFPSYLDVLAGIPSEHGTGFQGVVGVAISKARHQIAQKVWEEQFADAFGEGRELPGVPKSPLEDMPQNAEQSNPLRVIAWYAGAGMLAALPDTAEVAKTFMDPRVHNWANALRFVESTEFESRDAVRGRAEWAATYAAAFQKTVEQRLTQAHSLIRDHVLLELQPFMQVAQKAAAFALDVLGGAVVGDNYDGSIWRKTDSPYSARTIIF